MHWQGTVVCDQHQGDATVLDARQYPGRIGAGCLAHARRKFDELFKGKASAMAEQALQHIASLYRVERGLAGVWVDEQLAMHQALTKPLWGELPRWLQLQRARVADGGATAKAIDYSLSHWTVLRRNLLDGVVPLDNNHLDTKLRSTI